MDHGYANLRCVLKVDKRCDACKRHTMEILGSIVGLYDFIEDAERKTVRISAQVDPNICMKAIARCNEHAEVLWANLSHPKMMQSSSSYGHGHGYGYGYGYGYDSSNNYFPQEIEAPRIIPEAGGMWHDYPTTSYQYPYSSRINYLPQPQYNYQPPMDYYYGGDDYSLCSIM